MFDKWQPIDTLPKNGKFVLVSDGEQMMVVNAPPNCRMGRWFKHRKKWYGSFEPIDPIYWMPLPKQPKRIVKNDL